MVPKAKKNLHACEYHLGNLIKSKHFEEVEINFAAFVNSARNVTFVLQKEFKKHPKFIKWYGDPDKPDNTDKETKNYEMKNDELCKFFNDLRNRIIKEGVTNLNCSTTINYLNTGTDTPDKPSNSSIQIGNQGIYYLVKEGTPQEDRIPALTKGNITTRIFIAGVPKSHLGEIIKAPNILEISKLYLNYLQRMIEEWTGIINDS